MKKERRINHSPSLAVKLTVICDRNAATASAEVAQYIDGEIAVDYATGSAKRERDDVRDDVLATNLAVGRALVNLGRSLQHTARILVADASNRQQQETIRRVRNRLRRVHPVRPPIRLSIAEIVQEWGYEAGDRAADRRGEPRPQRPTLVSGPGKHERTDP